MSKIQLIVFDMAGTTVQDPGIVETCFAQSVESVGFPVSEEWIKSIQGWDKQFVFQTLWEKEIGHNHPDLATKVAESYNNFKQILEDYYQSHEILPTEGCLELFEILKSKGIKIGLNTGFYRVVTDIILDKLGWLKGLNHEKVSDGTSMIDVSVTSDEVNAGRPHPYMIFKAMEKLKIKSPKNVIHVGDTPSDLGAGLNAGCAYNLAVINGTHPKELLEGLESDGLLNNVLEVKNFL